MGRLIIQKDYIINFDNFNNLADINNDSYINVYDILLLINTTIYN